MTGAGKVGNGKGDAWREGPDGVPLSIQADFHGDGNHRNIE